jgi:peptidoglycan hydrolase-like protein with peptidoglycan-binding domain
MNYSAPDDTGSLRDNLWRIYMAEKFTIVLRGIDNLPNHSIVVQTIRDGLNDLFRAANKNLDIVIDRGIEKKTGNLTLDIDRKFMYQGPGSLFVGGNASGTSGEVSLDEHRSRRLERGIRSQVVFEGGRKLIRPDYVSQIQSLYEFDDPELARFIGNTALHEIGHMLGHKGSLNPNDVMYDSTLMPKAHGNTVESARRFYSGKASFLTKREEMIKAIKTGGIGTGEENFQFIPGKKTENGIETIKKSFSTGKKPIAPGGKNVPVSRRILSADSKPMSIGCISLAPTPLIRRGSRGSDVMTLQKTLGVKADGIYGPKTENAVRDFQRQNNLRADGIVGPQTRGRLASGSSSYTPPITGIKPLLGQGSRGQEVAAIQRTLGVKADGMYGPKTESAVRDFQRRNNLRVDGIVGPQTRGRLSGGPSIINSRMIGTIPLLRRGASGTGVMGIQKTLGVKADGIFGPKTESAVRDFQRRNNLRVDGIVGPRTRGRMFGGSSRINSPMAGTSPLLRRGASGTGVMGIQKTLGVKADGIFGPKTESAVRDFQRRNNLRVDGIVGPQTRGRMFGGSSRINSPMAGTSSLLRRGSSGSEVMGIQRSLGIKADGIFGSKTESAIRVFQRKNNLRVDGIVGPQTRGRMFGAAGPQAQMGVVNPLRAISQGLR